MAKRNRSKERERHGGRLADETPPEVLAEDYGEVTDDDLRALGAYATWATEYIRALYVHGETGSDHLDTLRMNKKSIFWHNDTARRSGLVDVNGRAHISALYDRDKGTYVPGTLTTRIDADLETGGQETVELECTITDIAISGTYCFYRQASKTPRPAPDISNYESLNALHEFGVSRRVVRVLRLFRLNVLGLSPLDESTTIPTMVPYWLHSPINLAPQHMPALELE